MLVRRWKPTNWLVKFKNNSRENFYGLILRADKLQIEKKRIVRVIMLTMECE